MLITVQININKGVLITVNKNQIIKRFVPQTNVIQVWHKYWNIAKPFFFSGETYKYQKTTQKLTKAFERFLHIMSSQSFSQLITVNLQCNGIKIKKQCSDVNCLKSVRIRGWSCPHYATFWVNTGTYSVSLHIQSKCRKKFAPEKSCKNLTQI